MIDRFQLLLCGVIVCSMVHVHAQFLKKCCDEYCYETDTERLQTAVHFGEKTAYEFVKGPENGNQYLVPNCKPVKMWLFSRHGTRLPKASQMARFQKLEDLRDEIIKNYESRLSKPDIGALCEDDLTLLRSWQWNTNITAEYSEFLTVQGWNDLKFLAIRLQRALPKIAETIYDARKFQFRHTKTQRAEASYKAFVEGLFGEDANQHINIPPAVRNDSLLRPYQACPTWQNQNYKQEGSEFYKFAFTDIFKKLANDVSTRLGFNHTLSVKQIGEMFDICRFEQAWKLDSPSPWCIAFTPKQIRILDYREDLDSYYQAGYGYEFNSKVMCAAMADLLKHMESEESPQMVAYFAHASGIEMLLNAMQVAKDAEPLRADNFAQQSERLWQGSRLSPFAANLAAVKYHCPNAVEQEKVVFFLNEKPLNLDWCQFGLCDLSKVTEQFKYYKNADCSQEFCINAGHLHFSGHSIFMPMIVLLILQLWK